jgi:hypothetical protein
MTGTLEVDYEVARWNSFIVWLVFEVMDAEIGERVVYFERALVFLLLRLRRLTRFFLHLALILSAR